MTHVEDDLLPRDELSGEQPRQQSAPSSNEEQQKIAPPWDRRRRVQDVAHTKKGPRRFPSRHG